MQNRTHFIWIILPILPLILGFALLNLLSDGSITLLSDAVSEAAVFSSDLNLRFFNALVIYAAVGLFQVMGCLAVVVFVVMKLRTTQADLRRDSLIIFGLSLVILFAINILARQDGFTGALDIAYRSTCAVMVKSGVAPHILPVGCRAPGLSHFAWLGLLPYVAGVLAAASASALVSTAYRQDDLETWSDLADQAFNATAFVLVASTIAMMLFYHLPLSVVENEDARKLITGFAQGMTLFWGITFTLTLMAVFAPGDLMLTRAIATEKDVSADLQKRIADRSAYKQASRVLTTLAPLLVGSSATVIEMMTGAFAG